ncbi:phage adaptor protein [Paenibacillus oleatilyticus]|uniref:Uncharacterized protein n=1 Tax=Paenibacillus oleatilyticus TaxID=2594886 RepID=A0ABV4VCK1_9BACL
MPLTLQQIIDEACAIVPNEYSSAMLVSWLNNINQDFFNIVKIPQIARFKTTKGTSTYTLPSAVRQKNIDLVMIGLIQYRDLDEESVVPTQNWYSYDDSTKQLTLNPEPYQNDLNCVLRYRRIATTNYTAGNLNAYPDAPEEYQWTYIPALCEYICLAMDDPKAANFSAQKTTAWNSAATDYKGGAE